MTVLLIAAEAREFQGLTERLGSGRGLAWPLDYSRAVRHGNEEWLLVANGPGPALAAAALNIARERAAITKVVNVGFCGGLNPALQVGEVFVASEVRHEGATAFPVALPQASLPFTQGPLISMDRVVTHPNERAALWDSGACAVEMEAAGIARVAAQHELPFYCIRAVSDAGQETLPLDFNRMRRPDGRFSKARIVSHALRRPRTLLPELMRLNRQAGLASRRLGEFLADCEF